MTILETFEINDGRLKFSYDVKRFIRFRINDEPWTKELTRMTDLAPGDTLTVEYETDDEDEEVSLRDILDTDPTFESPPPLDEDEWEQFMYKLEHPDPVDPEEFAHAQSLFNSLVRNHKKDIIRKNIVKFINEHHCIFNVSYKTIDEALDELSEKILSEIEARGI